MTDQRRLEIVFRGDITPGENLVDVRGRLRELFKADDAKLNRLFSGRPVVIRSGLDDTTATRYQTALTQAGAVCEVREMLAEPEAVATNVTAATVGSEKGSDWGIAPVGADVLNEDEQPTSASVDVDISNLALAPEGTEVIKDEERQEPVVREVDTSHLSLDPSPR